MPDLASSVVRIATRGSALALAQSRQVQAECRRMFPHLGFALEIIRTTGDRWQTTSLAESHLPKGLFTKELESALREGQADLAVHSLKDLPTTLPEGLLLGAVSARVDVRDVLIVRANRDGDPPTPGKEVLCQREWLHEQAVVATNSTRRAAQLRFARPDLKVVPIRGNVGTRLRKLSEQSDWRGTLLAAAGLHRLQYRILADGTLQGPDIPEGLSAVHLPINEMIPCVGQAALGFEVRKGDSRMEEVCRSLNHVETEQCVTAERSFLAAMGGGCQSAVAGYARVEDNALILQVVSFLTGKPLRATGRAELSDAISLGRDLAARVSQTQA